MQSANLNETAKLLSGTDRDWTPVTEARPTREFPWFFGLAAGSIVEV